MIVSTVIFYILAQKDMLVKVIFQKTIFSKKDRKNEKYVVY